MGLDLTSLAGGGILRTKLHPPRLEASAVERRRLLELLDHGTDRPLTLISAPAGSGKSVLLAQWIDGIDSAAWLALDERDNDLRTFVAHLVATIDAQVPGALVNPHLIGPNADLLSDGAIGRALLNDLDGLEQPLVVVLDDYHVITSAGVHSLMSTLLEHPSPAVHLVIASRFDPPLGLTVLRSKSALNEIRGRQLAFSRHEAVAVLERVAGSIDEATVDRLVEETEGWAVGLRLAGAAVAAGREARGTSHLDAGFARDYLVGEVLQGKSAEVVDALLALSLVPQFAEELLVVLRAELGHVGQQNDDAELFQQIIGADLFIVTLDAGGTWFRFHHLFGELLLRQAHLRLGADQVAALRRAASTWFADHGLLEDAIRLAIELDDEHRHAASLLASYGYEMIEAERWRALLTLVGLLPRSVVDSDLELLALEAWTYWMGLWQARRAADLVGRMEQLSPGADAGVATACVDAIRGSMAAMLGDPGTGAERLAMACDRLSAEHLRCLAWATLERCHVVQAAGDLDGARALAESSRHDDRFRHARWRPWFGALVYLDWAELDVGNLERRAMSWREEGQRCASPASEGAGHYYAGLAAYLRADLEVAAERLVEVAAYPGRYRPPEFIHATILLALCHEAGGRDAEAQHLADSLNDYVADVVVGDFGQLVDALQIELALRRGEIQRASAWGDRVDTPPFVRTIAYFQTIYPLVRALLADGRATSLQRSASIIQNASQLAAATNDWPAIVRLDALQALATAADGADDALRPLARAVARSSIGGSAQLIADVGAGPLRSNLVDALNRLDVTGVELDHVAAILRALGAVGGSEAPLAAAPTIAPVTADGALTTREADILGLLAARLSNKEIARQLLISPSTVKKHTIHLYQKLHVNDRRAAVDKARALGYLRDVSQPST